MVDYFEILKTMKQSKFEMKIKNLNLADNSITIEDVVSELYLHCIRENIYKLNDKLIYIFLKKFHSINRKHSHCKIIDTIDSDKEDIENSTNYVEELIQDDYLLERCKDIALTNEEILCLLYLHNKKSIKMYNYDFIRKSNEKSIDKNKLNKHYENIIIKILNQLQIEILN